MDSKTTRQITKAINQQVGSACMRVIKEEILKQLSKQQLFARTSPLEKKNRDVILVERNIRNKVGLLVLKRINTEIGSTIRVQLQGVRPKTPQDTINTKMLIATVTSQLRKAINKEMFK